MQHKTVNLKGINTVNNKPTSERQKTKEIILQMAKNAVDKFGGFALIDGPYAFVDTSKFTVSPNPQKVTKVDNVDTIPLALSEAEINGDNL